MDFEKHIDTHAEWNVIFRKAIVNKDTVNADEIARDDCCEVGKWIYGEGQAKYANDPIFEILKEKHTAFHDAAGEIARLINNQEFEKAREMIALGTTFSEASKNCSTAILTFKNESQL